MIDAPVLVLACLYLNDLDVYPDAERQEAERIMAIQSWAPRSRIYCSRFIARVTTPAGCARRSFVPRSFGMRLV